MTDHYRSQSHPYHRTDPSLQSFDADFGNGSLSFTPSSSSSIGKAAEGQGRSPLSSGGSSSSLPYSTSFTSPTSTSSTLPSYESTASHFSTYTMKDPRQMSTVSPDNLSRSRPSTSGDAGQSSANDNGAGPSMRNFLVPISGTGARQKLSILSAAQRPRTAQAATPANFFSASSATASNTHSQSFSTSPKSQPRVLAATSLPAHGEQSGTGDTAPSSSRHLSNDQANSPPIQRRPSTADLSQRPSRSNSASGAMDTAGFSPQLASVLTGQSFGMSISGSGLESEARRNPPPSTTNRDTASASSNSVRSFSYAHPRVDSTVQAKRSFSDLRGVGATTPVHGDSIPPTSNGKDKSATLKSGLKSIFQRSGNGKGAARPSTANSINTAYISAPQLQSASAMATPPSSSIRTIPQSISGRSFASQGSSDNVVAPFDGRPSPQQHYRKLSGQSQGPTVSHPYRSASRTSTKNELEQYTEAQTPPRLAEKASLDDRTELNSAEQSSGPSLETGSRVNATSPEKERVNGIYGTPTKPLQSYGRRPSQGDASRPMTAPAPTDAFYSSNVSDSEARSRAQTPILSPQASPQALRTSSSKQTGLQTSTSTGTIGRDASMERQLSSNSVSRLFNQSKDLPADPPPPTVYSAPNSSRSLSPTDPSKPSVPLTSPLLASLMGQSATSNNSLASLALDRDSSGDGPARSRTPSSATRSQPDTQPESGVSSSKSAPSLGELEKRPALPAKSRSRQNIDSDADQASSNENIVRTSSADGPSNKGNSSGNPLISGVQSSLDKGSAKTYVPADALKHTRKGTAVAFSAKSGAVVNTDTDPNPEAEMSTPKASRINVPLPTAPGISPSSSRGAVKQSGPDAQLSSFGSTDLDEGESSFDTVNLLPDSAWMEVEVALERCKGGDQQIQSASDKGVQLRTVLLPFLALEAETPETQVSGTGKYRLGKVRRKLFFDWIRQLLFELQSIQTSADRGAILESIACIIESRNLSTLALEDDAEDERTFFGVLGHILDYAIGELNKKGVYQNTLIFSGRLLAVAFFRIEGVASKLLRALPVNRFALERVANEAKWEPNPSTTDWDAFKKLFPAWLRVFCFEDARSYLKMLDSQSGQGDDDDDRFLVRQQGVEVEMSGNWLRRWQSDDSELFFSFCRNYHRQSSTTISSQRLASALAQSSERKLFFGGPGFAHLATCIHQKCLSLVHRDILSVTTLSSQKNFNPGETANVLSGSTAGKPRHLEAANRRCTAIIVDIVRAYSGGISQVSIFSPMLDVHIKCLVKRTSLYDVQGVFCLLDWLDGVLGHMESAEIVVSEYVDIDFLLQTIWLLLKDADHALALMRTIAFCYSNFAILTATTAHRQRFFEEILLNPRIFSKLFLSWSFTIRAYFLHLLVFRLARINDFSNPDDDPEGKSSLRIVKLFSKRLDEIRKRHDELSPQPSSADSQSDDEEAAAKRRPQSFVSTIRRTPSVHQVELSPAMTKAERVLGIGLPDPVLANKPENKAQSRAAKWLRVLGGKSTNAKGKAGAASGKTSMDPSMDSTFSRSTTVDDFSISSMADDDTAVRHRLPKVDEVDAQSISASMSDFQSGSDEAGSLTPKSDSYRGELEYNFDRKVSSEMGIEPSAGNSLALQSSGAEGVNGVSGNEHISPDISFDLQNASMNAAIGEAGSTQPSRISRAFSRRQSLLPGPALSLVHGESESFGAVTEEYEVENGKEAAKDTTAQEEDSPPYDRTLHIYAVQSLREYEQTVQEHDDFFSAQQDTPSPQVPRLPIQWPAMWSE